MAGKEVAAGTPVEIAGIPLPGVAGLVGELIMKQAQIDLVFTQMRALHKITEYSVRCECGLSKADCRTWPIIAAYDKQRRKKG